MHDWKTTPLFKSPFKSCAFQKAKGPASFYYSDRFFEALPLLFHLPAFFPSLALPFFYYYDYAQPFIPFQISCLERREGGEEKKKKTPSPARGPAAGNTMTRARPALGEGLGEPVWEQRPGLATSTQRAEQAHARLLIFMRGCVLSRHAPSLWLMGRGSTGRNLEGAGGSGTRGAA